MKAVSKLVLMVVGLVAVLGMAITGCAPAGTGTQDQNSTWYMLAFLVAIFVLFYFVMIRPQRKRQKEHEQMVQNLQKGDKVITIGGIYGTVESLSEDSIVLKVEGGTTIRVARGSIAMRLNDGK